MIAVAWIIGWLAPPSLLPLLRLVVVGADDVLCEIGFGRGIQHRRALSLEHERISLVLAHLLDEATKILQDLVQHGFFLLLQGALQVIHEPSSIPNLTLEELLLLAARVGREQLPLLLDLIAELLQLGPLRVHLL